MEKGKKQAFIWCNCKNSKNEKLLEHVSKKIGHIKLSKLTNSHVQTLYNVFFEQGLSTGTIKAIAIPFKQAISYALNNDLIFKNPCKGVVIPKKEARKITSMSLEEQQKFEMICESKESKYHDLFIFLLNTGLRCGEALALTWDNIDFVNNVIEVNKNMSRILNRSKTPETTYVYILSSVKTESGKRTIPLNKKALGVLNKFNNDTNFVFVSRNNTPLNHRNIAQYLQNLIKNNNFSNNVTIHSLRHTFATRLLEKGAHIKTVSDLMGHKDITITMNTYSHVLPNLKKETISLLD